MAQLAEEWLKEMGINPANTQYVIARHFDKKHPHCHLVFNRIANNGSVIFDSNERRRNEAACRRIKQRHGLTFGNSQSRKINPDRLRKYDTEKLLIRQIALHALSMAANWETFSSLLSMQGVSLSLCTDEKTRRIRGVAYEHDGFRISGSKLGLHGRFTYGNLCKHFGRLDEILIPATLPEFVKERHIIYIPIVRYIQILTNRVKNALSHKAGHGENREYEVGQQDRSWHRIDDRIEEETTTYKMKM